MSEDDEIYIPAPTDKDEILATIIALIFPDEDTDLRAVEAEENDAISRGFREEAEAKIARLRALLARAGEALSAVREHGTQMARFDAETHDTINTVATEIEEALK